eukprot:Hpha_TRINITY_DN14928_c0_g1::TRINITY_DN14928_c0_g1_i1::g.143856::m.143856
MGELQVFARRGVTPEHQSVNSAEEFRNKPLLDVDQRPELDERHFVLGSVTNTEHMCLSSTASSEMPTVDVATLLLWAVEVPGNEPVVSRCIAQLSPDAHATHRSALNDALAHAIRGNKGGGSDATIAVLLSKGASVQSLPPELITADLALIACACEWAVVAEVMAKLGDTFWERSAAGQTVLHAAVTKNRKDLLQSGRLLAPDKLSVDAADSEGRTPCFVAARSGHSDALRILIAEGRADVGKAENDGKAPCYIAAKKGHSDALRILIEEGRADVDKAANNGATPCYLAAAFGHSDALRVLIEEGRADVDKAADDGATPCYLAAKKGHSDALRVLIEEGRADVDKAADDGATPCYLAAEFGHSDALRVLIQEGKADVDKAMKDGETPCSGAAQFGHSDALRVLIEEGRADVDKAADDGATPC